MKRLVVKTVGAAHDWEKNEANRLVAIAAEKGYTISQADAYNAWRNYSDDLCAGWIASDSEHGKEVDILLRYCDVVETE